MTPLEINKKIAELKGFHSIRNGFSDSVFYCDKEKLGNEFLNYNKNWAENISDAWELFEEIPGAVISKDDDNEDGCNSYYCRSATDNLSIYGATATEAICLAWIKWKEGLTYEQRYNTYEA